MSPVSIEVGQRFERLSDKRVKMGIAQTRNCRHVMRLNLIQNGIRPSKAPEYDTSHTMSFDSIDDLLLHIRPVGNTGMKFIVPTAVLAPR